MPYDVALLSGSVHLVRRLERKALFAGEVEIMVGMKAGWNHGRGEVWWAEGWQGLYAPLLTGDSDRREGPASACRHGAVKGWGDKTEGGRTF